MYAAGDRVLVDADRRGEESRVYVDGLGECGGGRDAHATDVVAATPGRGQLVEVRPQLHERLPALHNVDHIVVAAAHRRQGRIEVVLVQAEQFAHAQRVR